MIEFEHGTATGRRVVKIDDEVLVNRDWMFRLVGDELFTFNGTKFVIRVDPIPGYNDFKIVFKKLKKKRRKKKRICTRMIVFQFTGFKYSYTLWVNGKNYKNFIQSQSKILKSWLTKIGENEYRIVLGNMIIIKIHSITMNR